MGPLAGLKLLEFAGVGPGPMAAMMLSDMGATVLRIERASPVDLGVKRPLKFNLLLRGRKAIALDLKSAESIKLVLRLVEKADGLIEGFRPGVMERLGLGPDTCLTRNPRLVYGRMTGWGQSGPLSHVAAHDLNYIALTGALHSIGRKGQPPTPPLTLVGDFAGGGLYLAFGIVCALLHAKKTGEGQVVDAAIVDGVAHLMTSFYGLLGAGIMRETRGENVADSGAFFYETYECADGEWITIAPIEQRFYEQLLEIIGLSKHELPEHSDRSRWEEGKAKLAAVFRKKTRAEWCALLENTDVCFAPVLRMSESPNHRHMKERNVYVDIGGVVQPAPAPRFSRTPPALPTPPVEASSIPLVDALQGWLSEDEIAKLET